MKKVFSQTKREKMNQRYQIDQLHILDVTFYSFFTSPCLPSILEVERTSTALNSDDVR